MPAVETYPHEMYGVTYGNLGYRSGMKVHLSFRPYTQPFEILQARGVGHSLCGRDAEGSSLCWYSQDVLDDLGREHVCKRCSAVAEALSAVAA